MAATVPGSTAAVTAPSADLPQVEIAGLRKVFQRRSGGGEVVPIDGVDLSVARGEFLVLLGPSGCGKTTLLRSIAGLERPDTGRIRIGGTDVFDSRRKLFVPPNRRPISMIFQSYALWPHMTVGKNVAYPVTSRKGSQTSRADVTAAVQKALGRVGLQGLDDQYPGQLSGGQQQRVALARALATESQVMLFDEPLSNVDAKVREQLRAQLVEMQRDIGFTAVYVTHDQAEAMELADRIAVLNSGRIEQLAAPREVYNRPSSRYVADFIGTANLYQGTVSAVAEGHTMVTTPVGEVIADITGAEAPAVGDRLIVMFRPEDVTVAPEDGTPTETGSNSWTATLVRATFSGTTSHLLLSSGDERVQATAAKDSEWQEGAAVRFSCPPGRVHLLPETAVGVTPGSSS